MGWEQNIVSDYPQRVELPTGVVSWQLPGWYNDVGFNRTHTANRLYFTPIFVARRTTFDRFGIDVNTASGAGSVVRMGLYAVTPGSLLPAELLNDFGTVLVDSTGDKLITVSLTLERGYYWTAHISDDTPQLECFDTLTATNIPIQAWEPSNLVNQPDNALRTSNGQVGVAVGGLDDPAPATDASNDPSSAAVHMRVTGP